MLHVGAGLFAHSYNIEKVYNKMRIFKNVEEFLIEEDKQKTKKL